MDARSWATAVSEDLPINIAHGGKRVGSGATSRRLELAVQPKDPAYPSLSLSSFDLQSARVEIILASDSVLESTVTNSKQRTKHARADLIDYRSTV
ncbi:hypothetical protein A1Q1_08030 [Trichosporon asahii var. asahii CBS 2479]|uniref:Uncharacterized protein n=1 Tax=Trichosporon asahii var. asahii (strain ATCC 90039 / CBS 2479 / JCM 2466 / KCTC 7840 / NBRC 103889/ NCYC 2677 / UAMH 7654) TaxID=1186058 RepID=J6F674_TRIAS|nr:hypothetical protein A1Q1_08030 [Trichosporon asahii var. asahii CBS 2479]EJT50817.1 hypothetical protein A1Q1_08030 [Trichosporon asahii var. asahii CBS 2479]